MGSWLFEYSHGDGIEGDEIMNKAVLDIYIYIVQAVYALCRC